MALEASVLGGLELEWLEADGRGGFAMGTALGIRTRRYHGLVTAATTPPTGRVALVAGVDVRLVTKAGAFALSSHEYEPGVVHPDGFTRLRSFRAQPWPLWRFVAEDGSVIDQELLALAETGETLLAFRLVHGLPQTRVEVRPLLSGRDYHATHHENGAFRFDAERVGDAIHFTPYAGLPRITLRALGRWVQEPIWYRRFRYREELARGLDGSEDLASPGYVVLELGTQRAAVAFGWTTDGGTGPMGDYLAAAERERARRTRATSLELAADAYVVTRDGGTSIVAGYPWFTDWGRDTFIALRGLCLARGRLEAAERILVEWSRHVKDGLLPNCFPDGALPPDDNAVDAPLWFVVAASEFRERLRERGEEPAAETARALERATSEILAGLADGTRHGIRADSDGLLAAGAPGRQLTWMDAKVGADVVTPRRGKPVEVQALWLNALRVGGGSERRFRELHELAARSFRTRFASGNGLFDVVDVERETGTADRTLRPNQILAVGGLSYPVVDGRLAREVVDLVEDELVTARGVRSLGCREPGYRGRYDGSVLERDRAYHQGTAWPWLLGPFVEAWLRVRGDTASARRTARERFVAPWLAELEAAGLGHVSEIADGDFPHRRRGAPFQAWSLGELVRTLELLESDRRLL